MPSKPKRPLTGVRVLVGRARHQAGALSAELRKLGATVVEIPFIEIRPPRSFKPLDKALHNLDTYDWLILTSVNGVEAMWQRLGDHSPYDDLDITHDRIRRWHPLNQSLYVGYKVMLPGLLMISKGDRIAMNASVETRYPFLDEDVTDFCAGIAPQYGLFAATYGLAATLFARHPIQVVITGRAGDAAAQGLETAAHGVFRFGKSVLRVTPGAQLAALAGALKETLAHVPADKLLAVVCSGQTCLPPTSDPAQLKAYLENGAVGAAAP